MTTTEAGTDTLVTRTGLRFTVRVARPEDQPLLADFFRKVTPEDLRFRFLSGLKEVSHDRLREMTSVDHDQTESYLAFAEDGSELLAMGMLATDAAHQRGEVAISIRADHKGLGIGWTLLDHIANDAKARGLSELESIENRENRAAIELEREMGFVAEPFEGDASLVVLRRKLA